MTPLTHLWCEYRALWAEPTLRVPLAIAHGLVISAFLGWVVLGAVFFL